MASGIYNRFKANLMNKIVDLEADTIRIALMNNSHGFIATHSIWGNISANEVSGTGYTPGGGTLTGKAVTEGASTKWDATDFTWPASTITAYHAVVVDISATSNLICSFDFGAAKSSSNGNFTIQFHADGILDLT